MQYDNEDPPNEIHRVLARVRKEDGVWVPPEPDDPDQFSQWAVFGTNEDFANVNLDFEDIVLHAADVATLVFARDADGDGLYAWDEQYYGTSDNAGNDDYDGDGLTDYVEVSPRQVEDDACGEPPCFEPAGWDVEVQGQAQYRIFSDPRAADADEDGLNDEEERGGCEVDGSYDPTFGDEASCTAGAGVWLGTPTDPNKKDTDGDGIPDFDDAAPTVPARTLRVKQDSPGGDGSTWDTAFPDLQDAILEAKTSNLDDTDPDNDVSEIWVASGEYTFSSTQPLLPHVGIYGGFVGGETKRSQRAGLTTIIDGSPVSGFTAFATLAEGPYADGAVLDGLMLTNWNPGAMRILNTTGLVLRNMHFIGNGKEDVSPEWHGGAISGAEGSWTLEQCVFANNVAAQDGGAISAVYLQLVIRDCQFLDNRVVYPGQQEWGGGAISIRGYYARLSISTSRFVGNKVTGAYNEWLVGGAINAGQSGMTIYEFLLSDCHLSNNALVEGTGIGSSQTDGAAVLARAEHVAVTNCVFTHNVIDSQFDGGDYGPWLLVGVGLSAHVGSAGALTNCTFVDNVFDAGGSYGAAAAVVMRGGGLKRIQNLVSARNRVGANPVMNLVIYDPTSNYDIENICLHPVQYNVVFFDPWGIAWVNPFDDTDIRNAWGTEVIDADPGFVSNPDPGTDYWGDPHLGAASILIDAGNQYVDVDPATLGIQFVPEFDLDGNLRIMDGNGDGLAEIDIGAYEYSPY
jgi:predicted outer membrane repeat protein